MAEDSRERILRAAADLLARDGYNGTGLKAISEAAGLPYGSIYHHFPGGKEQIATTAIDEAGGLLVSLFSSVFSNGVTSSSVKTIFPSWPTAWRPPTGPTDA